MKKLNFLALSIFIIACAGCKEDFVPKMENEMQHSQRIMSSNETKYTVSLDSALAELDKVLEYADLQKGHSHSDIKSVSSVSTDVLNQYWKTIPDIDLPENIYYLVNYGEENGFAILTADKRAGEIVLAITEKGTISPKDFELILGNYSYIDYYQQPLQDEFGNTFVWDSTYNVYQYLQNGMQIITSNVMQYTCLTFFRYEPIYEFDIHYGKDWFDYIKKFPLVFVKWGQNAPYNNECYTFFGHKKAVAGCVPIAVIQMFSAHEKPTKIGNLSGNWQQIKTYKDLYYHQNEPYVPTVAKWVNTIGKKCTIWYGEEESSSNMEGARRTIATYDEYYDVHKINKYDEVKLLEHLNANKPVVYGSSRKDKNNKTHGHAWVIDGYLKQYRVDTIMNPLYGSVPQTSSTYRTLVHCNFGYEGSYDGYYLSALWKYEYDKLFDMTDGPIQTEPDAGDSWGTVDREYCFDNEMITYKMK
ncbi:MAG: C10 family peptidase [Prevotellaceae bacterium]|jgi:hypothetical protein|nr:C10 family peptidase [Prevotellaceae bacterium]